jgi:hypothetical protein
MEEFGKDPDILIGIPWNMQNYKFDNIYTR